MKRLLSILSVIFVLGCSAEDDSNSERCCDTTISELKASYTRMYNEVKNDPEATDQQKAEAQAEYEARMESPCFYYKISLENSGASCENP